MKFGMKRVNKLIYKCNLDHKIIKDEMGGIHSTHR